MFNGYGNWGRPWEKCLLFCFSFLFSCIRSLPVFRDMERIMGMHNDMVELVSLFPCLFSGPRILSPSVPQDSAQLSLRNFWVDVLLEKLFGDLNWQKLSVWKSRCSVLIVWFVQSFGVVCVWCILLSRSSSNQVLQWWQNHFRGPGKFGHGFRYSYYARWDVICDGLEEAW